MDKKLKLPTAPEALPGRATKMAVPGGHPVLGSPLEPPFPAEMELAMFGMGCFWGAERKFWQTPGVYSTSVGYAAGVTPNPTYREVCTGLTGHNEVVRVAFDPARVSYAALLEVFWRAHNPTLGMRQGNDIGTQYRSGVYTYGEAQHNAALASRDAYQPEMSAKGRREITTEILAATAFYYAEEDHQQYLHKNPSGYCGLQG